MSELPENQDPLPPPPADPARFESTTPIPPPSSSDEEIDPADAEGDAESEHALSALLSGLGQRGVPAEVRDELGGLWGALSKDVKREVGDIGFKDLRSPSRLLSALKGMTEGLDDAQSQMVDLAVRHPLPVSDPTAQLVSAAAISGTTTAAEQAITYGSAGTAIGVALVGAVMAELLDTYVLASTRVLKLQEADITPTQRMVESDLQRALGGESRKNRRKKADDGDRSNRAVAWLTTRLARKVTTRMMKSVALAVGVGWASASAIRDLKKVQSLALPSPGTIELDPDAVTEHRRR